MVSVCLCYGSVGPTRIAKGMLSFLVLTSPFAEQQKAVAMTAFFFHFCTRSFKCNILQSSWVNTITKSFILVFINIRILPQRANLSSDINTITCSRCWFIKTMLFKLTSKRLIVPCWRARTRWIKIPKGIFRWVVSPIIQILFC